LSNFLVNPYWFVAAEQCQTVATGYDSYIKQDTGGLGNIIRIGIRVTSGNSFIGESFTSINFALEQKGSPTGDIICKIYAADNSTISATSSNKIDTETELSGSMTNIEFTFSSTQTVTEDYHYIVMADGTNNFDGSNGVKPQVEDPAGGASITGNNSTQYTDTGNTINKTASGSWCIS